jgi:hypothetical protein
MAAQWVHLPGGDTLVASEGAVWIQEPVIASLSLRGPMTDLVSATPQTTKNLLDGAIAAAERGARAAPGPPLTPTRWAWELVGQWYCAHHGVALLPELIQRFRSAGRVGLAEFARRKLDEEQGHDLFPLDDLRALGYDAPALVHAMPPPPIAKAEVDYARACARGDHPVEFFGYMYAQERRVTRVPEEWLADLDAVLPPGVEAASAIRLHANELDLEHVEEAIRFIAGLPADHRTRVAQACYRTTQISCAAPSARDPTEAELETRFLLRHRLRVDPELRRARDKQGDRS